MVAELQRISDDATAGIRMSAAEFGAKAAPFMSRLSADLLVTFHRRLTLDLLERVARKTPVDVGRARGNWQVSVEAPASGETGRTDVSGGDAPTTAAGVDAAREGAQRLVALRPFGTSYVANNVPYISVLEGGWSDQAPAGMVAVSLAELQAVFP
jgi:hypothetical protein